MNRKQHLMNLPDIPRDAFTESTSKDQSTCVLIPLFFDDALCTKDDLEAYVKSAAWQLLSWERFSDIQEYCIYVALENSEMLTKMLISHNVPERLIRYMPDVPALRYCKKLRYAMDETLSAYEYLVVCDADTFVIGQLENRLPLFRNLAKHKPKGILGKYGSHDFAAPGFHNYSSLHPHVRNEIEQVVPLRVVDKYSRAGHTHRFVSATCTIVNLKEVLADQAWWEKAINTITDDELLLSVWSAIRKKERISDISPYCCIENYSWRVFDAYIGQFKLPADFTPFLFHPTNSIESLFYKFLTNDRTNDGK